MALDQDSWVWYVIIAASILVGVLALLWFVSWVFRTYHCCDGCCQGGATRRRPCFGEGGRCFRQGLSPKMCGPCCCCFVFMARRIKNRTDASADLQRRRKDTENRLARNVSVLEVEDADTLEEQEKGVEIGPEGPDGKPMRMYPREARKLRQEREKKEADARAEAKAAADAARAAAEAKKAASNLDSSPVPAQYVPEIAGYKSGRSSQRGAGQGGEKRFLDCEPDYERHLLRPTRACLVCRYQADIMALTCPKCALSGEMTSMRGPASPLGDDPSLEERIARVPLRAPAFQRNEAAGKRLFPLGAASSSVAPHHHSHRSFPPGGDAARDLAAAAAAATAAGVAGAAGQPVHLHVHAAPPTSMSISVR